MGEYEKWFWKESCVPKNKAIIFLSLSANISDAQDSAKKKTKRNTKRSDEVRVEITDGVHRILVNGNVSIEYRPYNSEEKELAKELAKRLDAHLPRMYGNENK